MGKKRVYHFCDSNYGIQNLKKKRLKIATIMDLNDPFELLCHDLGSKEVRARVVALKKHVADRTGMVCFSRSYKNPVQWVHYGEKHKGICLGFDIDEDSLTQVTYKADRLVMSPSDVLDSNCCDRWGTEFLSTKYAHWKYEEEERVFFDISGRDRSQSIFFQPIGNGIDLRMV